VLRREPVADGANDDVITRGDFAIGDGKLTWISAVPAAGVNGDDATRERLLPGGV
jgi:hypothetical protein